LAQAHYPRRNRGDRCSVARHRHHRLVGLAGDAIFSDRDGGGGPSRRVHRAAARCTPSVDRGAALCQSRQRSGAAIFRRRDHRGSDHRPVAHSPHARDSRNSAFAYKDKPVNAKQIGRELGVRYVLEGSVRRSGNQVRVNAQLIDAETDAHLWAERFERDIGDLFALQNEITSRIAIALNLALVGSEAARPSADPDALDYILRGRAAFNKPPTRDNYAEVIGLFERALALDPHSAEAQSLLANALSGRVLDGMSDTVKADTERAEGLVTQALAASPGSPIAHYNKGQLLRLQRRPEEAILEFETVLAVNRNSIGALFHVGWCKLMTGAIDEVIPLAEQAIRLSPRDPIIANFYNRIGQVHLLQSRINEAIPWLEKARSANAGLSFVRANLASAYALKGETERAATELAEARRLWGEGSYSSIARMAAKGYWGVPKIRALFEATDFVGLRKAGVPEE
jgi:adenylate cyclase